MEAPGLVIEKNRLAAIGSGLFLGIVGDAKHSFGYHLASPPSGDYSLAGVANYPVGSYSCAIDISMSWKASRTWLTWLITEIRDDRIQGIAEVIGSFNGRDVRYWSDNSGWQQNGVAYEGAGHDTWTHVAVYRTTAKQDHRILAGWTANGYQGATGGGTTMDDDYGRYGKPGSVGDRTLAVMLADLWMQNTGETSPYVANSPSRHTLRLINVEAKVDQLTAKVNQILARPQVALDEGTIALIVQQLAAVAGTVVADEIAQRMRE